MLEIRYAKSHVIEDKLTRLRNWLEHKAGMRQKTINMTTLKCSFNKINKILTRYVYHLGVMKDFYYMLSIEEFELGRT